MATKKLPVAATADGVSGPLYEASVRVVGEGADAKLRIRVRDFKTRMAYVSTFSADEVEDKSLPSLLRLSADRLTREIETARLPV